MAITSRIRWLAEELNDARSLGLTALLQILKALNVCTFLSTMSNLFIEAVAQPDLRKKYDHLSRVGQSPQNDLPNLEDQTDHARNQVNAMDFGEPIPRSSCVPPLETAGSPDRATSGIMLLDEDDLDTEPLQPTVAPAQGKLEDAAPIMDAPPIPHKSIVAPAKEDVSPVQKPKRKPKKPKKRDEIDDIFGF